MRVSDHISQTLVTFGVEHVFMLTGGGSMFLNDSIGNQTGITTIFNHHEQACAMAAEGYARISGKPGVVIVTTGPGGINALNGVFGAWTDSIPLMVISGQVKRETLMSTYKLSAIRQIGDQEADTISIAKNITKYAVLVNEPTSIKYHLEKAWHLAQSGRPGPVWLDIPIDVQSSNIDVDNLPGYDPREEHIDTEPDLSNICKVVLDKITSAKRPVIMAGKGIQLGQAEQEFEQLIRSLTIPVVPGWTSIDIIENDDPLYCGRPGDLATRAGNFTVQNSDLLLILGSRLGLRQVSYNWKSFARFAYKIHVDIDKNILENPLTQSDLPILCDVKAFMKEMNAQIERKKYKPGNHTVWLDWCKQRVARYPVVLSHHRKNKNGQINPYHFIDRLFTHLTGHEIVACGDGTANVVTFQAARIKKGQRIFANTGDASMGYDLPASIGACVASKGRKVICLAGDGSLQLNIQELQTIVQYNLPIKLFVLNNNGYLSIRLSQRNMFGRVTGESSKSGVSFPDIVKIAGAYGIPAIRITYEDIDDGIVFALNHPGPIICDVFLDPDQPFEPRISSKQLPNGQIISSNLEDMFPFLEEQEMADNMLVPYKQR